jgi:tetratricopeptide (TPR) repeat protein
MPRLSRRAATCRLILALAIGVPAWAAASQAIDLGGSEHQLNQLDDAWRAAHHGRYTEAVNRASAVIAQAPDFAEAYYLRADFLAQAGRFTEALGDLDRVALYHPNARQIVILRAQIALRQRNAALALSDLAQAGKMPAISFWKQTHEGSGNPLESGYWHVQTVHAISYMFAYASIAEEMLGHDDAALHDIDEMMKNETVEPHYVLAEHCYYAAVAGLADMAELTCTRAIATQSRDIGDYDSLGLAHLKMKAWDKAITDYNHALDVRPDLTLSLYGRGIAKRARGDIAGGDADIAAATKDEPDIANIMAQLGVVKS